MCPSASWLLVSWLVLGVGSATGDVSPPQNLSLTWINEFHPRLTWAPPPHWTEGCTYIVKEGTSEDEVPETTYTDERVMNGGYLRLSVVTECNGTRSEEAVSSVSFPDLVRNPYCYRSSSNRLHCTWEPVSKASNVRFYYSVVTEGEGSEASNWSVVECQSYSVWKGGCDLEGGHKQRIYMLFNETWNNASVWNTFERVINANVRAPPINWAVHEREDRFHITWTPPDIGFRWNYVINYTECGITTERSVKGTQYQLDRVPHCPYNMKIKAQWEDSAETEWSEEKHFGPVSSPNAYLYAAITIPLLFAILAALAFVCCRKNKENIFPKIPQPRNLLSDIADNNNKSNVCNLYLPATEEETCKITLVMDHKGNKLDC